MNQLYLGDCLNVLRDCIKDETVDLVYIDPPFNSKRNYNIFFDDKEIHTQRVAFEDTWSYKSVSDSLLELQTVKNEPLHTLLNAYKLVAPQVFPYLVMMTLRILELHRVLKETGSFYLHCDPTASHYLKTICDAIFGEKNFKNEIVWKRRTNTVKAITKSFSTLNDTIYFYTKSKGYTFDIQYENYPIEYLKRFKYTDEYGQYRWQVMATYSDDRLEQLKRENKVRFSPTAKYPEFKQYLHELKGVPLTNIWTDIDMLNSQSIERLGYPTQKPRALLERIIQASSNEGI